MEEREEDGYAAEFAKRLHEALGDRQQSDILKLLNQNGYEISQQRLSHYFNGRNYPDPPVLKELVSALGVSADWLIGLPTETTSSVADLDELIRQNKGEAKINKIMKVLPKEQRQQVLQFAEYLLSRHPIADNGDPHAAEALHIELESEQILDLVERTRGEPTRKEVEKIFRDRGLFVKRAS